MLLRVFLRWLLVLLTALLFISACVSEPEFDRTKFAELSQTAQELKAAISSGTPCELPDTLLQRLSSGITAIKGKAKSKKELDLISAYSYLLTTCKDGLLLCRSRNQFANLNLIPKGRIYVSQELDPLVERFDLPTEKHLYKHTGQYMRSIDGNSIGVIWESTRTQIKNIENMMNYN